MLNLIEIEILQKLVLIHVFLSAVKHKKIYI